MAPLLPALTLLGLALAVGLAGVVAVHRLRRGRGLPGLRPVEGRLRVVAVDRLVLDAAEGAIALPRSAPDLGPRREDRLAPGDPMVALARIRRVAGPSPYRAEARASASRVVAAAPDRAILARRVARRAGCASGTLGALAVLAALAGPALAFAPEHPAHDACRALAKLPTGRP
jgi:hypothetical protein